MELLYIIIIAALFIQGLHYSMLFDLEIQDDGTTKINNKEVLWFVRFYGLWFLTWAKLKLEKPFFECPVCMSSIWGTLIYSLLTNEFNIIQCAIVIAATGGLGRLLNKLIQS